MPSKNLSGECRVVNTENIPLSSMDDNLGILV